MKELYKVTGKENQFLWLRKVWKLLRDHTATKWCIQKMQQKGEQWKMLMDCEKSDSDEVNSFGLNSTPHSQSIFGLLRFLLGLLLNEAGPFVSWGILSLPYCSDLWRLRFYFGPPKQHNKNKNTEHLGCARYCPKCYASELIILKFKLSVSYLTSKNRLIQK